MAATRGSVRKISGRNCAGIPCIFSVFALSADSQGFDQQLRLCNRGCSSCHRLTGEPPPWQREIDRLMGRQLTASDPAERKRLYDRVQQLAADHLPVVFLISPNFLAGAAGGLGNFRPAILDHSTLWNADELYWRTEAGR